MFCNNGSIQHALVILGAAVALGGLLACGSTLVLDGQSLRDAAPMLVALGITGIAGLVLVLNRQLRFPVRIAGVTIVGLWLVVIPMAPAGTNGARRVPDRNAANDVDDAAANVARQLFATPGLRTASVRADVHSGSGALAEALGIDLEGPRWDAVLLCCGPAREARAAAPANVSRRVVQRCARSLLRGGRLVIELPNRGVADAALEYAAGSNGAAMQDAFLLRLHETARGQAESMNAKPPAYEALVIGNDAAAWLLGQAQPEGFELALYRVSGQDDLQTVRLAAAATR
jgi:hypothetical protein